MSSVTYLQVFVARGVKYFQGCWVVLATVELKMPCVCILSPQWHMIAWPDLADQPFPRDKHNNASVHSMCGIVSSMACLRSCSVLELLLPLYHSCH